MVIVGSARAWIWARSLETWSNRPATKTFVSDSLAKCCQDMELVVPNTSSEMCVDASMGTFHVNNGTTVQCDYVVTSVGVAVLPHSVRTLADFRMDNEKADHRPLAARVVVNVGVAVPPGRRRKPVYDRKAVRLAITSEDPALRATKRCTCVSLDPPPAIAGAV